MQDVRDLHSLSNDPAVPTAPGIEPSAGAWRPPRLRRGRLLRGANVHHTATVYAQPLRLGSWRELRSVDAGGDFVARFEARFGTLACLSASGCVSERARTALRGDGLGLADVLLEAILAVERHVMCLMRRLDAPTFTRVTAAMDGDADTVELVWSVPPSSLTRAVVNAAFVGLLEILPESWTAGVRTEVATFEEAMVKLRRRARRRQWSATNAVLAHAAVLRDLPYESLAGNYLRLGDGALQCVVSESTLGLQPLRPGTRPRARLSGSARLHQLLVIDDEIVSALRIDAPTLIGDGESTVEQLLERLDEDPRRNGIALRRVARDRRLLSALARRGIGPDHVLPQDEALALPGVNWIERGAIGVDVTDRLRDDVREAALRAVAERDVSIAAVDYVGADVTNTARRARGRVVDVRPVPEFFRHALPDLAHRDRVAMALLHQVFDDDADGHVPVAMIVGDRGTRAVARELDRMLRPAAPTVALAVRGDTTIGGRPVERTARGRDQGPGFLLRDPRVGLLVAAATPGRIVREGLRVDRCAVTAVLDPDIDADAIERRRAVEVAVGATRGICILAVDHPDLDAVLALRSAHEVVLVSPGEAHPTGRRHLAAGGRVVTLAREGREGVLQLRRARTTRPDDTRTRPVASLPMSALRMARSELGDRRLRRALFVAAVAFALDVELGAITWHERAVDGSAD